MLLLVTGLNISGCIPLREEIGQVERPHLTPFGIRLLLYLLKDKMIAWGRRRVVPKKHSFQQKMVGLVCF